MTKLIKGDVVTMRGTVTHVDNHEDRGVSVKLEGYYTKIFVDAKDLSFVHHQFEAGARVWSLEFQDHGIVRAIHGDCAWVQFGDVFLTVSLDQLEHAPVAPVVDAEAEADIVS